MADFRPEKEPVNLGEEADVKKRNVDIKREAVERASTLNQILQHRHGRRFIYWLLGICKVSQPTFAANALIMSHTAGEQNIGLRVLAECTTKENIDLYVQMLKEGTSDDDRK